LSDELDTDFTEGRRARRIVVEDEAAAFVEIDFVRRSHWKLSLVEISPIGVSFRLEDGRPSLAVGSRLQGVRLDVVGLQVSGNLRVAHVTRMPGAETICGAEFQPSTEADHRMMALVLSSLEKRSPDAN
jgi:hypothetical protein